MIELPESHVIAGQMREALSGKRILKVEADHSPHKFTFYQGDPATYPLLLEGLEVSGARPVGGMVELLLGDMRMTFGDGVNFRLLPARAKLPMKYQLRIEFSDHTSLVCSVQMYGAMLAFRKGEQENPYYQIARQKPTPYAEAFNCAYFGSLLSELKPSASVKAFLATEQRIPGLGNGVLQDILFQARIHPKSKVFLLCDTELDRLYHSVKETLCAMRAGGGRDTERDLYGHSGQYRVILSKNTLAMPCSACGGPLKRQAYLGGNIYFCPVCQPCAQ